MAFIRIKKMRYKGKTYIYSHLVENYWENGKVKQRHIKSLGRGDQRNSNQVPSSQTFPLVPKVMTLPKAKQKMKEIEDIRRDISDITPTQNSLIEQIIRHQTDYWSAVEKRRELADSTNDPKEFRRLGKPYKKIMRTAMRENNQAVIELRSLDQNNLGYDHILL